jgi:hypothetical protein
MSSLKLSWKNFLLSNPDFETSNNHILKMTKLCGPESSFETAFEELSKNSGISFISLDPSESEIQLFHHNQVLGGSWDNPKKVFASVRGIDNLARPIQIIMKSVKSVKAKTPPFMDALRENQGSMSNLVNLKSVKKIDFLYSNIIPIPHLLTKAYLNLSDFDPLSVAQAFYSAIQEHDRGKSVSNNAEQVASTDTQDEESETKDGIDAEEEISEEPKLPGLEEENEEHLPTSKDDSSVSGPNEKSPLPSLLLPELFHIFQFCYLCFKKKMPPVHNSIVSNPEIDRWFDKIVTLKSAKGTAGLKRRSSSALGSPDSENSTVSPESKVSKKDQYFLHTMLKIHDTMDKNYKEKSDKEPGFARLEDHRKNLILNASAIPPYRRKASSATEFYSTFLAKKSQFKAKDMLVHQLHSEKTAFNPSSSFVNNLWNCEFFWLLPDSPSGVSIFFCPETRSTNASDIEKERMLALADKVNISDIEKMTKQKLHLPNTIMDLVWMTQNLHAVIKLCFGPFSHSATFLKSWADHMYENRLMYSTSHSADPYFFAKVLYAIDHALQVHWRSCSSNNDRLSVNDRVLLMEDVQESILGFSFARNIPKPIADKVQNYLENKDKDKGNGGKQDEEKGGGGGHGKNRFKPNEDGKGKAEVVHNSDKSHPNWRLKDGENFSKLFYHRQKDCPKTSNGKLFCMKFLIRGICDSACTRAHTLSNEDSKRFDEFVSWCRSGGQKPDF